jgi:hypothetical protein
MGNWHGKVIFHRAYSFPCQIVKSVGTVRIGFAATIVAPVVVAVEEIKSTFCSYKWIPYERRLQTRLCVKWNSS